MSFDPAAFMSQTVEGPMATSLPPVPEGEYLARIGDGQDDVKVESIQGKKDPTRTYIRLTLMWDVIDENLKAALGRDKIRVRDQFLIDVDQTTGLLKSGPEDNVSLGQRREALGMNDGAFSIARFRGAGPAIIRVSQRSDANDPSRKYSEVARVVKVG